MYVHLDPYPYADYNKTLRTAATRKVLHQVEQETVVLLENRNVLPLGSDIKKVAVIGPQADRVSVCSRADLKFRLGLSNSLSYSSVITFSSTLR